MVYIGMFGRKHDFSLFLLLIYPFEFIRSWSFLFFFFFSKVNEYAVIMKTFNDEDIYRINAQRGKKEKNHCVWENSSRPDETKWEMNEMNAILHFFSTQCFHVWIPYAILFLPQREDVLFLDDSVVIFATHEPRCSIILFFVLCFHSSPRSIFDIHI